VGEQIAGEGHPFRAVARIVFFRRRPSGLSAPAHQQLERGHLGGFHDPLAQLRLDALGEVPRIAVLMPEGPRTRGHG
jgi:hypothetical protein